MPTNDNLERLSTEIGRGLEALTALVQQSQNGNYDTTIQLATLKAEVSSLANDVRLLMEDVRGRKGISYEIGVQGKLLEGLLTTEKRRWEVWIALIAAIMMMIFESLRLVFK